MIFSYRSALAIATLAGLCTACSQGNMASSSLPNATAGSAVTAPHSKSIAPQAQRMLSLRDGHHAVIPAHVGVARLFAPVPPPTTTLYDSIVLYPDGKTGDNLASEGFECCQVDEFGDALNLTQSDSATNVSVVMQSWGCQSGFWYSGCVSATGSKFAEPITLTIYSVALDTSGKPHPGTVLVKKTKSFNIPYRPTANSHCVGYYSGAFIGKPDGYCDFGVSKTISFNVSRPIVPLPQQVIVTLAYNTSDSGYSPYGQNTTCFTSAGGCGYDSLNVSANGNGGFVGSPIDPDGVQVYYTNPNDYTAYGCTGYDPSLTVQDSYPCWTGFHPDIQVTGT
jgi:hypothetical protein